MNKDGGKPVSSDDRVVIIALQPSQGGGSRTDRQALPAATRIGGCPSGPPHPGVSAIRKASRKAIARRTRVPLAWKDAYSERNLLRKLTYYVAASLDGFIAGPDGDFSFFALEGDHLTALNEQHPETVPTAWREAAGIDGPNKVFDTVLMGRGTYEMGIKTGSFSPYRHLRQVVFSTGYSGNSARASSWSGPTRSPRFAS